ncbi:hypothetical protein KIN20_017213 [Parelaphostrongylus tenuis]|uniref:Uncharacterized protein n=1 Tax=Parelaphostrongylus tenuis TaxID=148309 RepID=A0AAD5N0K1_PARTN|nr:hypothetical protein KIN20_017213 [Parelaphostrongylus tenuis]
MAPARWSRCEVFKSEQLGFINKQESPKLRNTNNSRNLKDERDPGKTKWWRNCNRVAGRFRNLSGKVSHKVKTFFSRPVREPATKKLISRIEARRRAQNDNNMTRRESRSGQRAFSQPRNRLLERLRNGPDQTVAEENCSNREESAELVNDNGNAVIVNGLPFWITADDPLLIDQIWHQRKSLRNEEKFQHYRSTNPKQDIYIYERDSGS